MGCSWSGIVVRILLEILLFLLREGEEVDKFYMTRRGRVALQLFADRRGPLTVSTLEAGDILAAYS